jgi:hypothetical protein
MNEVVNVMTGKIGFERDYETGTWHGYIIGEPDIAVHLCAFCKFTFCEGKEKPAPCIGCVEFELREITSE